jgi:hypothetical protein
MTLSFESVPNRTPRLDRCRCLVLAYLLINAPLATALDMPQHTGATIAVRSNAELTLPASNRRGPRTYLAMIGPGPLRFADPPPQLPPEPAIPKPPAPPPLPAEHASAKTPGSAPPPGTKAEPATTELVTPELAPSEINSPKPILLLPDDIKREVRPEDVIPFFQFPGSGENVSVSVPSTPAQPRAPGQTASSATYQQK